MKTRVILKGIRVVSDIEQLTTEMGTMDIFTLIALIACAIGGGMGLYGLFQPQWIAQITRLEATAPEGRSEFRASFSGLFFATHASAAVSLSFQLSMAEAVSATVGMAWLGAAFGRGLSFAFDDAITRLNLFNIGMELVMGLMLLGPLWAMIR